MPTIQYIPELSVFGCHVIGWWDWLAGRWRVQSAWATEHDAKAEAKAVYEADRPPASARVELPASLAG